MTLADRTDRINRAALDPVQYGDREPAWRLWVAGEDWSRRAEGLTIDVDANGSSECSFVGLETLEGYEEERVSVDLGYGSDLITYFGGRLYRPGDPEDFWRMEAIARGPYAEMVDNHFVEPPFEGAQPGADYRGRTIGAALYDIARRAAYPSGTVEVRGQNSYLIDRDSDEAIFVEENTLQEGAEVLLRAANYVVTDTPGPVAGHRVFQPRPRPGAEGFAASYTERDYPVGAVSVTERPDKTYTHVIVFRRNESGSYAVREVAPVDPIGGLGGPRRRTGVMRPYYIPEFVGTRAEARQTAYEQARILSQGMHDLSLDGVALNPALSRYRQVQVQRIKRERSGEWREWYKVMLSDSLTADVASWRMSFGGEAVLYYREQVARPAVTLPDWTSPGVLQTPLDDYGFTGGRFWYSGESEFVGVDEAPLGFWIDEEASGGRIGIDHTGRLYVDYHRALFPPVEPSPVLYPGEAQYPGENLYPRGE